MSCGNMGRWGGAVAIFVLADNSLETAVRWLFSGIFLVLSTLDNLNFVSWINKLRSSVCAKALSSGTEFVYLSFTLCNLCLTCYVMEKSQIWVSWTCVSTISSVGVDGVLLLCEIYVAPGCLLKRSGRHESWRLPPEQYKRSLNFTVACEILLTLPVIIQ